MEYEIFYSILNKNISSREVFLKINELFSNPNKIICTTYEGGGIWIQTNLDPNELKSKLEEKLGIKLGNPKYNEEWN